MIGCGAAFCPRLSDESAACNRNLPVVYVIPKDFVDESCIYIIITNEDMIMIRLESTVYSYMNT